MMLVVCKKQCLCIELFDLTNNTILNFPVKSVLGSREPPVPELAYWSDVFKDIDICLLSIEVPDDVELARRVKIATSQSFESANR